MIQVIEKAYKMQCERNEKLAYECGSLEQEVKQLKTMLEQRNTELADLRAGR